MPGESKTSARNLETRLRHAKALELRLSGRSYQEIADEIGYQSRRSAHRAVARAMEEHMPVPEDLEETRRVHRMRLYRMLRGVWPKEVGDDDLEKWDDVSFKRVLDLTRELARLEGLYSEKLEHKVEGHMTIFELLASPEVRRAAEEIRPDGPAEIEAPKNGAGEKGTVK